MGLAQREIEQAGITTVSLSNVPDLTAAVGVPRLVAVEYPFGQIMGNPGDREVQSAVLRAALDATAAMQEPGSIRHLPYEWLGTEKDIRAPEPPPIAGYLKRHPWQLPKLFSRDIPRA